MRDFEPTPVLRPDGSRTGGREARSGRLSVEHTVAAPLVGERGSRADLRGRSQKESVHNVHTLGFGSGSTGFGPGRIGYVFGGVAVFQGLAPGSSPTSGTHYPSSEGFLL